MIIPIETTCSVNFTLEHVLGFIDQCDGPLDLFHIIRAASRQLTPEHVEMLRKNTGDSAQNNALLDKATELAAIAKEVQPAAP